MSDHHRAWEYHVSTDLTEETLNQLGEGGWELVSIEAGVFYLKRRRLSFREQVTLNQKQRYYALWNVQQQEQDPL